MNVWTAMLATFAICGVLIWLYLAALGPDTRLWLFNHDEWVRRVLEELRRDRNTP